MLRDFKPRLYQETIFGTSVNYNTLVVLPTGMGKTSIALMLGVQRLKQYPNSKILILAPTKPLVEQIMQVFISKTTIDPEKIAMFTGHISPAKREAMWKEKQIIATTPQGLENDIISRRIDLKDVSLMVFDECLTEDTKVLLATEEEKTIKQTYEEYVGGKELYVKSYNLKSQKFENSKVIGAQKIPCIKKLFEIKINNNQIIKATQDHKFLANTKDGIKWLKVEELNFQHKIALYPFYKIDTKINTKEILNDNDIINTFDSSNRKNLEKYSKAMQLARELKWGARKISKQLNLGETQISNWIYQGIKPIPIKTINAMKKINLLPLTYNNCKLKIITRIIGHLFGDGWFSEIKKKNSYLAGFSGSIEGLKDIQKDLDLLGLKYSNIHSRKTKSTVNNIEINGTTNSFTCCDKRIVRMLLLLGTPVSKKVLQGFEIPKWIRNGPKEIKREFLGALFGSEGSTPKERKNSTSFYSVRFTVNKADYLEKECREYVNQIKKMLKDFDVKVSQIKKIKGNTWKNKKITTIKMVLTISNEDKNMLNFFKHIPFRYEPKKNIISLSILEYLKKKENFRSKLKNKRKWALLLKDKGISNKIISKMLEHSKTQIEKWVYGITTTTHMVPLSYRKYDDLKEKECSVIWTDITSIKEIKQVDWVYDLTIEKNHNFIANGFIVHNCHRAVKDYSYVWVAKQYNKQARYPRILALTASPGSDLEVINEVCQNLFIEEVEVRTDKDPDVKEYIQEVKLEYIKVKLPIMFKEIQKYLKDCINTKIKGIKDLGVIQNITSMSSKRELLGMQAQLRREISEGRSMEAMKSISLMAEIMKVSHGVELLETQGISALYKYLEKINQDSLTTTTKATQNLVKDINFRSALVKTRTLFEKGVEHPKLGELRRIVEENEGKRIIVFNQYRDSAKRIVEEINSIEGATAELFVGQAKKNGTGLSQKKQIEMLENFRNDKFNVLVSSSVGEEGLDIPQVDIVIFFEPVPSAVRTIQRRGRTGRLEKGRVIILMAEGTRDVGYKWSAHHKENRMHRNLELLRNGFKRKKATEQTQTLTKYLYDGVEVYVDYREKGSGVIKNLIEHGCNVKLEKLSVGDYVLSNRCAIEYKTQEDFVDSMLDGRLLTQVKEMKNNFSRPIIMVEGNQDIYGIRNIHTNAIRGMIATITISYSVPILFTKDFRDSSAMIAMIAKREQKESGKNFSLHGGSKPKTLAEQQEYVVSALPGIGATLAKPLLEEFGSVKNIVNAELGALKKVEKIGEIKAKNLKEIFEEIYKK